MGVHERTNARTNGNTGRHFGSVPGATLARVPASDLGRLHLRVPRESI